MLRTACPSISIITNWGCRSNCWYCIWKTHPLKDIQLETDWKKLEKFLEDNRNKGKVSVSGGGDCLYKYDKYLGWWIKLFEITKRLNMKVDVHTREKFTHQKFWKKINRCVFSSDKLEDDKEFLEYIINFTNLRITYLVTQYTTSNTIEEYLAFQDKYKCQLTIKQLVGFDDCRKYEEIIKQFPDIYHLDAGDYNIYYMPDNTIRDTFLF